MTSCCLLYCSKNGFFTLKNVRQYSIRSAPKTSVLQLNQRTNKEKKTKKLKFSYSSLLLLTVPGLTFCLGCWQIKRLKWKQDLIAELNDKVNRPAVEFPFHDFGELDKMEYRRVHLKGRFIYKNQFAIRMRGRFDSAFSHSPQGLVGDPQSSSHGGHIITPMRLEGTNVVVMVNRGWLPREQIDVELEEGKKRPDSGVKDIDAILRLPQSKPAFFQENQPESGRWFYKNFDQMAQHCNSLPIFLDAVYESTETDGPIGGQTNITLRNEHFNYLITW